MCSYTSKPAAVYGSSLIAPSGNHIVFSWSYRGQTFVKPPVVDVSRRPRRLLSWKPWPRETWPRRTSVEGASRKLVCGSQGDRSMTLCQSDTCQLTGSVPRSEAADSIVFDHPRRWACVLVLSLSACSAWYYVGNILAFCTLHLYQRFQPGEVVVTTVWCAQEQVC